MTLGERLSIPPSHCLVSALSAGVSFKRSYPLSNPNAFYIAVDSHQGCTGVPAKSPSEGSFPFLVTLLRRLGIPRCDWASVEDLGSVCIEHMILSCLGESSCYCTIHGKKGAIASRRLDFYLLVHGRYFISLLPPIGNQWRRSPIRHLGTCPLGVTGSPEGRELIETQIVS
ncbi:hypothetical protein TNCV_2930801 [Trichonephila clavipes]|nr:hypothetical protein TNCV_2930801 [Trichonephila clavipes]